MPTTKDLYDPVEAINQETNNDSKQSLDKKDEKLLEDLTTKEMRRSLCHKRSVSWLKKTEYISEKFPKFGTTTDKTK